MAADKASYEPTGAMISIFFMPQNYADNLYWKMKPNFFPGVCNPSAVGQGLMIWEIVDNKGYL